MASVAAAVLAPSGAFAQSAGADGSSLIQAATANGELRYFTWRSNAPFPVPGGGGASKGYQLVAPVAGQLVLMPSDALKVEVSARTSYMAVSQSGGAVTAKADGLTDTTLAATTTYLAIPGMQPFLSVNTSLPTGRSSLPGRSSGAKGDSDIVPLPAFGEGFNLGVTAGVNLPVSETTMVSLGAGHTRRGEFDREGAVDLLGNQGVNRLDPGDVTSFTATLGYRGERLSLKGSAAYSVETVTTLDALDFYQSGDRWVFTGAAGYAWTDALASRAQVTFSHFEKNRVRLPGLPALVEEAFNSNSNVLRINVDATYSAGSWSLGPVAGFVWRDENAWDPTTFQFLPAKVSWSAGLAGRYTLGPGAAVSARVERIWVHEGDQPTKIVGGLPVFGSAIPAIETDAWQLTLGGTLKF